MDQTPTRYSTVAKTLHWVIAIIMITMLIFGQGFEHKKGEELQFGLAGHSSLGLMVIGLVLLRIFWRAGHPPPALPAQLSPLQKRAAQISHLLLYGLMIYLPVTGLIAAAAHEMPVTPFGAFDLRNVVSFFGTGNFDGRRLFHEIGTKLLIGLLLIHIGAAMFHHFVQKDNILRRMLPWGGA